MPKQLRVLIVEDSEDDALLMLRELRRGGYDPIAKRVETPQEMGAALDEQVWDAVLADFALPRFSGSAALELVRSKGLDVPFLVVSGAIGEETAAALMRAGAHDYVRKTNLARLVPAIERELKEAEGRRQQQRAEEEVTRLAAAVEQTAEAIIITGREGSIEYVNPAFEKITGYSRVEGLGHPLCLLKRGPQDDGVYRDMEETYSRGAVWSGLLVSRKKDGSFYQEERTVSPVRDASGTITHFVAVVRDVTEQARLERQLSQAQRLEALGTLAGGIAHDFNNALMPILGYTELTLAATPQGSDARENLEHVLAAAERARGLVQQILAFSRVGEQKRRPLRVSLLLKETVKFLQASLPASIEIRRAIDTASDMVVADPTQIHQVLMNLCTNAGQAMGEEGGVLGLALADARVDEAYAARHPGLSPGDYLCLTVTDTGCGMDPKTLERIFEPFFTTKTDRGGTGLGLAVVHGIVKSHGGAIFVESEVGRGSSFRVFLPKASEAAREESLAPDFLPEGDERILFVDDEAAIAELGKRMLKSLGYRVTALTSSVEALELVRARPREFDLVITDQIMPRLSGAALAREILGIRPDLPIVVCTGFSEQIDTAAAEGRGFRAVVMKPLRLRELAVVVWRALGKG